MKFALIIIIVIGALSLISGIGGFVALMTSESIRHQSENLWIPATLQVLNSILLIIGSSFLLTGFRSPLHYLRIALAVLIVGILLDSWIHTAGDNNLGFYISVILFQVIPSTVLLLLIHTSLRYNHTS